ncbi:MAG: glycosyltransferase [Ferruginibacter sp.]
MTIAVNLTYLFNAANKDLINAQFIQLAAAHSDHQFIFIVRDKNQHQTIITKNITEVISHPRGNTVLLWKLWYNYTLPALIRKHKADVLINADGACSLRSKIKQYLFINDCYFLKASTFSTKKQFGFLQKNATSFLNKSTLIFTHTSFQKKNLIAKYTINENKIELIPLEISSVFQPMDFVEKETVKDSYADGREYFLFNGDIHPNNHLINLLKAFSFFKKRQKSNMQLLITAKAVAEHNPFVESLKTYKFRNEVKVLFDLPGTEIAKITAASYAVIYPAETENFLPIILQAHQCEVPLLLSNSASLKDAGGAAALYFDDQNFNDIADKMMLIFKDENGRSNLIKEARSISNKYKETDSSGLLWELTTTG